MPSHGAGLSCVALHQYSQGPLKRQLYGQKRKCLYQPTEAQCSSHHRALSALCEPQGLLNRALWIILPLHHLLHQHCARPYDRPLTCMPQHHRSRGCKARDNLSVGSAFAPPSHMGIIQHSRLKSCSILMAILMTGSQADAAQQAHGGWTHHVQW